MADYGAKLDKYEWIQTETQVTINIKFPKEVTSNKLNVKIKPKHLTVGVKGQTPIIDGDLPQKILVGESLWFVTDGAVEINLAKSIDGEKWWSCAVLGDPEIDVSLIEGEKYLDKSLIERIKREKKEKKEQEEKEKNLQTQTTETQNQTQTTETQNQTQTTETQNQTQTTEIENNNDMPPLDDGEE